MKDLREKGVNEPQEMKSEIVEPRYGAAPIIQEMNRRFDALERLIVRGGWGLFVTLIIGFLSVFLTLH